MLEYLKQAHENEEQHKRASIEARKQAEAMLRGEIGLACDVSIYLGALYGSVGQLTCKVPRYSSIDLLPAPSVADLEALLAYFPPVPTQCRKGTTTIKPAGHTERYDRETDTREEIDALILRIKPGQWQEVSLEWYGMHDGELWRVKVELSYALIWKGKLGKLDLAWHDPEFGREKWVERCEFYPIQPFKRIRWSTGQTYRPTTPNEFTLYAPQNADVWAFVKPLLAALP